MNTISKKSLFPAILMAWLGLLSIDSNAKAKAVSLPPTVEGVPVSIASPPVRVKDGIIRDKKHRQIIFHGLNIMNKGGHMSESYPEIGDEQGKQYFANFYVTPEGDQYTLGEQWAQFFAEHGFNGGRVGIFWNSVEPSPGVYDDDYIRKIRDMVRMFGKYGIFSILDFHQDYWWNDGYAKGWPEGYAGMPLWTVEPSLWPIVPSAFTADPQLMQVWDNFWNNRPVPGDTVGLQDRFLNMYQYVVKFFKEEPYLLSYSDLNEKNPDLATWECLGYPTFEDFIYYNVPLDKLVTDCSGFYTGLYADFKKKLTKVIRDIDDKHIVQNDLTTFETLNMKAVISDQKDKNSIVGSSTYYWWDTPEIMDYNREAAHANGSAFISTEWGGFLDPQDKYDVILDQLESAATSHFYWVFNESERIYGDAHTILYDPSLPPTGSNINAVRLQSIIRPYPRAVVGTIDNFHYSLCTNTFTLNYDSKFKDGLLTEVYIPTQNYPEGYNVDISGGTVVSDPNSTLLLVNTNKQSDTVSLTVTGTPGFYPPISIVNTAPQDYDAIQVNGRYRVHFDESALRPELKNGQLALYYWSSGLGNSDPWPTGAVSADDAADGVAFLGGGVDAYGPYFDFDINAFNLYPPDPSWGYWAGFILFQDNTFVQYSGDIQIPYDTAMSIKDAGKGDIFISKTCTD